MSQRTSRKPPAGPLSIREMELEDLPDVYRLGERLFTSDLWPNLYRTWDEYELVGMFASDSETCLVASAGDEIVGFILGTVIDKRKSAWMYGYVVWLGVDPTTTRRGVASRLLERLTQIFSEMGVRILMADTDASNTAAIEFFRRQGFGNESEHVYMTRNLTQTAASKKGAPAAKRPRVAAPVAPKPAPLRAGRRVKPRGKQ
jgi:ribosomal protein S18 acetylase RimI-like enzyme